MPDPESIQPDWRAELARQERDIMWLARHTGIHYRSAYRIFHQERQASPAQLAAIARALGMKEIAA